MLFCFVQYARKGGGRARTDYDQYALWSQITEVVKNIFLLTKTRFFNLPAGQFIRSDITVIISTPGGDYTKKPSAIFLLYFYVNITIIISIIEQEHYIDGEFQMKD